MRCAQKKCKAFLFVAPSNSLRNRRFQHRIMLPPLNRPLNRQVFWDTTRCAPKVQVNRLVVSYMTLSPANPEKIDGLPQSPVASLIYEIKTSIDTSFGLLSPEKGPVNPSRVWAKRRNKLHTKVGKWAMIHKSDQRKRA